ncbi:MAG: hypothetical protein M3546_11150 [Actinomycetota bacterium]|nr:hypothetical protein [Actinomycetota bacterium]
MPAITATTAMPQMLFRSMMCPTVREMVGQGIASLKVFESAPRISTTAIASATSGTLASGAVPFGSGTPGAKPSGGSTAGSNRGAPPVVKKLGARPTATAATFRPFSSPSSGGSRATSSSTKRLTAASHASARARSIAGSSFTETK